MYIPVKNLFDNLCSLLARKVYLDNNATTPLDRFVRKFMEKIQKKYYGNPSSMHGLGLKSREIIEDARSRIAGVINAEPGEIYFTSGATEANNSIIKSIAAIYKKGHFITSAIEHQSVLSVFKTLEGMGFSVSYLDVDKTGMVDLIKLKKEIRKDTLLISIMHVNNEIGSIQKLQETAVIAKSNNILFHSDIVQSFGKIKINVKEIPVDYLSISSHKINGPKGMGAMFIRSGAPFKPLIEGGHQESAVRAGTEAFINIAGFGKACDVLMKTDSQKYIEHVSGIKGYILKGIKEIYPEAVINGSAEGFAATINIRFPGIPNNELISYMDYYKIYFSAGSACVAGSDLLSHVLVSLGLTEDEVKSSIRIGIGRYNSIKDAKKFLKILAKFKNEKNSFFKYVFAAEFNKDFDNTGKIIVDLRDKNQVKEFKSLPGAVIIKPGLKELKKLPRDKEIILICEDGYISNYLAPRLRRIGYKNVKVLFGGYIMYRMYNKEYFK